MPLGPSAQVRLRWEDPWLRHGAADLFDDPLQVVHVLGDPAGHLGVVTAASLGDAHRGAGREQLLDDVVAQVPFGSRLIRPLSSVWFGLAWPSPAWPWGPGEEG